jgi:hypothetical protein
MAFYGFDLSYIFALVIAAILGNGTYNRSLHPLGNIPSPFWTSITKSRYLDHTCKGEEHGIHVRYHQQDRMHLPAPHSSRLLFPLTSPVPVSGA